MSGTRLFSARSFDSVSVSPPAKPLVIGFAFWRAFVSVLASPRSLAVCFALLAPLALLPSSALAQDADAPVNASDHPLLRAFSWRNIGPFGQGGRVDDLAVHPDDPYTYFVGFATGGLWKTTNNGTTFEPVFDSYGTHSVGRARDRALEPGYPLGRNR